MIYVAIYRALAVAPPVPTVVARGDDYAIYLHPGPLVVRYSKAWADPGSPTNALVLEPEPERRDFPPGSYIIVETVKHFGTPTEAAKNRVSQLVALLDVEFPGLAHEKVYEGMLLTPGTVMHLSWEEGYRFHARDSYSPDEVAAGLQERTNQVLSLSQEASARFALAARWFQRANDADNSIDRVLFYYTTLEVFPAAGTTDVPGAVARFLAERLPGATLSPSDIKARLNLGRICGFRAEIIHNGKASVSVEERATVDDHVQRLRAIARTCLRLLAGFDPGSDLDRFLAVRG